MRKGLPVSPGVVVAPAYCLDEVLARREPHLLDAAALSGELERFDQACAAAARELDDIIARVSAQVGEDEANIFRAHRLLLRDPALLGKVKAAILDRRLDARTALQESLDEYAALFAQIQDEYLRERMADVRDVVGRIAAHLSLEEAVHSLSVQEPSVLVAGEILPSQAMAFDRFQIAGIVTETGSTTGHAAILARSLGIPAVAGLRGICREIHTGDLLAVDGREGYVYIKPGPEVEAAYRKLQREYVDLRDRLIENRDQEAVTRDGTRVELLANVNSPADAALAARVGAGGVGLYRTEYLFLTHPSVPNEEEQLAVYRQVIEAAPCHAVTIRMLDLGGDKQVPYLGSQHETNPFMGWRSIRLSSAHPELFQTQLRAILRASCYGQVSLLFPMISAVEEVQRLKRMVLRVQATLRRQDIPFDEKMPIGVLVEVPAAALCVDALLDDVDFVSVGSNDLIQYVMAADRDNPKVAHLCEPFSPAILKLLQHIIKTCNARGKPVTVCGEMAGRPRCFLPLFGMGLRRLSMSPALIPPLKELIRHASLPVAQEIGDRVLRMKTFGEIRGYLTRKARRIWPNVSMLDTSK
jgi:phosphoenolpyruvate-protein phosphotransferase